MTFSWRCMRVPPSQSSRSIPAIRTRNPEKWLWLFHREISNQREKMLYRRLFAGNMTFSRIGQEYPFPQVSEIISIFHGCMVWIEKSVTRLAEWCRTVIPCDGFFYPYHTPKRYVFMHTFWLSTFDFQTRTWYKVTLFPLKSFYSSLKKPTLPATAIRFFTLTSCLHKVT